MKLFTADWIYRNGAFHKNLAILVGDDGRIQGVDSPEAYLEESAERLQHAA